MIPHKLLLAFLLVAFSGCKENKADEAATQTLQQAPDTIYHPEVHHTTVSDSLALLQLVKDMLVWSETKNTGTDFEPLQEQETDTVYAGLDLAAHQKRVEVIQHTDLFSQAFVTTYNRLGITIDQKMKDKTTEWYIGELAPFSNGANPWCNCQDTPANYLDKIWINNFSNKNDTLSGYWTWGDGVSTLVKAVKENDQWKISYLEGFAYDYIVDHMINPNEIYGKWDNGMVILSIRKDVLAFEYHGQCVYFYPLRQLSDRQYEMVWERDMDCKFDNGTGNSFGLKEVPVIGRPFSSFTWKKDTLLVSYHYPKWVAAYSKAVNDEVFTERYFRKRESF